MALSPEAQRPTPQEAASRDGPFASELKAVMSAVIQKVLRIGPMHDGGGRMLPETAVTHEDILAEAFWYFVRYPSEITDPAGLAATIARGRALKALEREIRKRNRFRLVSGDEGIGGGDGPGGVTRFDLIEGEEDHADDVIHGLLRHRLVEVMREALGARNHLILWRWSQGLTNEEIAAEVDLTPQRVGQIVRAAQAQMLTHPEARRLLQGTPTKGGDSHD